MFLYIALFSILFAKIIQYHWNRRHLYKLSWSLNGSYSLPIIGDGLQLNCKNEDILEVVLDKICYRFPSPIKFWFGPLLTVWFTEINHVQKIMMSSTFAQKGDVYRFIKEFTGTGLIGNSGPKWRSDRRIITPLFTNKQTDKYFSCMVENSEILAQVLAPQLNKPKFNVKKCAMRCSADIVNETIMGVKTHAQDGHFDYFLNAISFLYIHVHSRISKAWLHSDFIYKWSGQMRIGMEQKKKIRNIISKSVREMEAKHKEEVKRANLGEPTEIDRSVLNSLFYFNDQIPGFANHEELIDHMATFYTASEDTITILTCFALTVFGMHLEIQNRIYEELRQVFGSTPRTVELEDLPKLNFLKMCIKDILRLFPIAPFIIRKASQDFQIDKWTIPKNCTVAISIFNVHRDPKLWERPNEFYPEHFLPEAIAKRNPCAFLAYSAGPRGCIGKSFANMAVLVILATLLQRYEFISEGKLQDKKLKADITTRYKDDDYSVRIVPRIIK